MILQRAIEIGNDDDAISLEEKLSALSADQLINAVALIESGDTRVQPQDPRQASYAPKLKKETGRLHWERSAEEIRNLVRGCVRWPGAFTCYKGKLLKIYKSKSVAGHDTTLPPGMVVGVHKDVIEVSTGNGMIVIEELQLEGGRRMPASEFIAGHKLKKGDIFSGS